MAAEVAAGTRRRHPTVGHRRLQLRKKSGQVEGETLIYETKAMGVDELIQEGGMWMRGKKGLGYFLAENERHEKEGAKSQKKLEH